MVNADKSWYRAGPGYDLKLPARLVKIDEKDAAMVRGMT
jgi:hypothetical protein